MDWLTRPRSRDRWRCTIACALAIVLGLASRQYPLAVLAPLGKYPGDVLWAMVAYFGLAMLMPRLSIARLAALTAIASLTVELLKLYKAPWMIAIRGSIIGYLVFGHVFSYENLVAYTLGIALAVGCDGIRLLDRASA